MPRSHSDLSFWKGPPRSFGGPFFVLHTASVLRPPCLALRASIVAALLREIRPVAVAGGRVSFCGVSLALAGTRVSFSGSAPLPLLGPCAFRRFCPVGLVGSCGFACLLCGGACTFALARGVNAFFVGFRSCRSDLPVAKTKISLFLQLFAIADPCLPLKGGNGPLNKEYCCAFAVLLAFKGLATIRNRKKLQKTRNFCFQSPGDGFLAVLWVGQFGRGTRIVGKFNKVGL